MSDPAPTAAATCFDCEYDLRVLPTDARCPECGLAVAESAAKFERLLACGAVVLVRRATLCIQLAAAAGLLVVLLLVGVGLLVNYFNFEPDRIVWLLYAAVCGGSLTAAVLAWRASVILLRRSPPGGRFVGRLLGTAGWVVPLFACMMWLVAWADPPSIYTYGARDSLFNPALVQAAAIVLVGACFLYVPAFLTTLHRRVRLWPQRSGLSRVLGFVAVLMWIGLALTLPSLVDAAHELIFDSPLFDHNRDVIGQYSVGDLSALLAVVGAAAYSCAAPVAIILVLVTFVGAGRLQGRLTTAPGEEVGEERQPAAVGR